MTSNWLNDYSVVGSIQKPHGVKGEVRVQSEAQSLDRLQRGQKVYLADPKTQNIQSTQITSIRAVNGSWIIKFKLIETREMIPEFRFFLVLTDINDRPQLEDGHFYYSDMKDLKILDSEGQEVGVSIEVLDYPSVESIRAKVKGKEILIPWINEAVTEVDVIKKFISVDLDFLRSVYDI